MSFDPKITRLLAGALLWVMLCLGGCAAPSPTLENDEAPTGDDVTVPLAEKSLRNEFGRARKAFASNYREFLEREELNFNGSTLDNIAPSISQALGRATRAVGADQQRGPLRAAVPLIVLSLFLAALTLADRQAWRIASRVHARASGIVWNWLEVWARIFAVVAGRTAPVLALIALSYFPVQAVFGRAMWTLGLTTLLWLLFWYRALMAWTSASFAFELFDVPDMAARLLEGFGRRTLRLVFGGMALIALGDHLRLAADVRELLVFCYELALLGVPIYLLFMKGAVLALFPEPEGGFYSRLHAAIIRYYRAIILTSAFLLGLRAAGYVHASTFILLRGYGLLLMFVLFVAGGSRLRRWMESQNVVDDERHNLLFSIQWALRVVAILTIIYTGLRLLAVWSPLVIILQIPIVNVGEAMISAFSVINSALLFLGFVLMARFVRAVLVLRVFPAFEVEVGVGYAVQTLTNYALIVIGFFVALIALGVNLSAMTVVLASLGVGIGFGLQTITENLISGFILLFGRSVKKGDIITVGNTFGQVHAVGAHRVLIRTPDNFDMLIPSKEIVGGQIVNWSHGDTLIRHRVPVGVTYSCNPREVEEVLIAAAKEHPNVLLDPAPEVWLDGFGDSSVNFTLLVYFDTTTIMRDRLNGQINFLIWDGLAAANIEIPFPQRDLHLKSIDFADQLRPPRQSSDS